MMFVFPFVKFVASCAVLASVCLNTAFAGESIEITWDNLIPPQSSALTDEISELQAKLEALDEARKEIYYQIDEHFALKRRIKMGFVDASRFNARDLERLNKDYAKDYSGLVALWKSVQEMNSKYQTESSRVNESISGKSVRIPGYVLPLETEGTALREFLLVPFVGACIHVPPPPPNQMVHVLLDQPYASKRLYEPVWVEGVLTTGQGSHRLSLVDGTASVGTGYSMRAVKVIKHSN